MKPPQYKRISQGLTFGLIVWLLLGLASGMVLAILFDWPSGSAASWTYRLLLILLLFPIWLLGVGVHEAGHVFAGMLGGFTFRLFTLGPFMGEYYSKRWHFRWNTTFNLSGGMAMMLPNSTHRLKRRFLHYIAGGPIASLLMAVLTGWFSIRLSDPNDAGVVFTDKILLMTSIVSGLIFFISAIPLSAQGLFTDGKRFLELLKANDDGRADLLLLSTIAQLRSGKRPADLDPEVLEHTLRNTQPSLFTASLHQYLYLIYTDRGELNRARSQLTFLTDTIHHFPKPFRGLVYLEEAFYYAYFEHWPEKARKCFDRFVPTPLIPAVEVLRADAAIAWCEGRIGDAHELARCTIQELPALMESGKAPLYESWMNVILSAEEAPGEEEE